MKARVTVYPRAEVVDPQGRQIQKALDRLGYTEVEEVRAGKSFEVEIKGISSKRALDRLEQMCEELLANPLVEDYEFEMVEIRGKKV